MQKQWIVVIAFMVAGALGAYIAPHPAAAPLRSATCGEERWSVKTLQDDAGRALNLSNVVATTVSALRAKAVSSWRGRVRAKRKPTAVPSTP